MVKKIIMYMAVIIILATISFFTGAITTKHRLMEQHRVELELARARSAVLSGTIESIREEISGFGESLSRQRTNTAQLRELIKEARARYEKMEKLLNDSGNYNNNVRNLWNSNDINITECEIGD